MNFIIVIRGVAEQYLEIKADIAMQFGMYNFPIPIFAHLPGDEPSIEIVWIDPEMELKHLAMINEQISNS